MKRLAILLVVVFVLAVVRIGQSSTLIYDEVNGIVYVGGMQLEKKRYDLNENRSFYLANKIYELNIANNESKLIVQTDDPIYVFEVSDKGFIAVSVSGDDIKSQKARTSLIIYDRTGKVIKEIKDVPARMNHKYFSWSKDGSHLVYVSGETFLEGNKPFEEKGIWIYDTKTNNTKQISDKGVQARWSLNDNNIYIQGDFEDSRYVFVYETSKGQIEKSEKKGIVFSGDGKYYFGNEQEWDPDEGTSDTYFISNSNSNERYYEFKTRNGGQIEWMGFAQFVPESHCLLMWHLTGTHKILEVDNKTYIRKTKTRLLGWNKDMTKVVVYEGGDKIHIDELLTGKRLKSIEIPK